MRKVEVVPYNEQWVKKFQEECVLLKRIYGDEIINMYHIGSTAIPHIHSKPIIDILLEVRAIENIDKYDDKMEQHHYVAKGENGIRNRRYFKKGGDNRTHHVHMFQTGNDEIERHRTFRDYMIAHPNDAREYSELKQGLAKQFPTDIESYIDGKNDFIKEIDQKATAWRKLK